MLIHGVGPTLNHKKALLGALSVIVQLQSSRGFVASSILHPALLLGLWGWRGGGGRRWPWLAGWQNDGAVPTVSIHWVQTHGYTPTQSYRVVIVLCICYCNEPSTIIQVLDISRSVTGAWYSQSQYTVPWFSYLVEGLSGKCTSMYFSTVTESQTSQQCISVSQVDRIKPFFQELFTRYLIVPFWVDNEAECWRYSGVLLLIAAAIALGPASR